ncbi:SGNH/GDSL hydrolase family protein [Halobaculum sp. MBLA0147]|uniref:SGNH/GDSL hydrolase family protein n=1 Tax=Halobaculum sp. MBLA0147 TaxID=3079934 RepID=UPI003523DACE
MTDTTDTVEGTDADETDTGADVRTVLVVGDSVPAGDRTDADAWPGRLPDLVPSLADATVRTRGGMGTTLPVVAASLAEWLDAVAPGERPETSEGSVVVLVHAGHNDAQLSGGEPRVAEATFRDAAVEVDRTLSTHPAVHTRAFVGLVPLLQLDEPGTVPFADAQPDRSLQYDETLAETVDDHVPVARPVDDWRDRTADGVHPDETGHAFLAERVASWVESADS